MDYVTESARARVIRTIRIYRDTILDVCAHDAVWAARVRNGDASALLSLLERACAYTGLGLADYVLALQEDPSLCDLQRLSLDEIFLERADPGPYSEISRESPAGTPDNYHLDSDAAAVWKH